MKIKWTYIITFLLLGLTAQGFSRSSASHAIRIRIVRPNTFSVKPLASNMPEASLHISDKSSPDFALNWKTSDTQKRITVSATNTHESARLIMNGTEETKLTEAHQDLSFKLASSRGKTNVRFTQAESMNKTARLVYTLTDL